MDPIVAVIVIAVVVPLAVVWALAKSASLRGPAPRRTSSRPVASLVTEAVPEEHPSEDEPGGRPAYPAESEPSPPADSA